MIEIIEFIINCIKNFGLISTIALISVVGNTYLLINYFLIKNKYKNVRYNVILEKLDFLENHINDRMTFQFIHNTNIKLIEKEKDFSNLFKTLNTYSKDMDSILKSDDKEFISFKNKYHNIIMGAKNNSKK